MTGCGMAPLAGVRHPHTEPVRSVRDASFEVSPTCVILSQSAREPLFQGLSVAGH